jgi:tRNA-specific 2-thiouridylase
MKAPIAVALSGGVDSLVAAHLLCQQGHVVIGLHFSTGFESVACKHTTDKSLLDQAQERLAPIASQLKIPVKVFDFKEIFQSNIVDYFVNTYQSGQTPNPCLICNPIIKFNFLAKEARKLGVKGLATGHYARRRQNKQSVWRLYKGIDPKKDQSYFLARLTQEQLAFARFPLGDMTKRDTIDLAQKTGLHPVTKEESQDICFITNKDYGEFLARQPGFRFAPGPIVDTHGKVIGTHPGLHRFTIGQRRGINCPAAEPYYVVRIIPAQNCLVVGFKQTLYRNSCNVTGINWINAVPSKAFKAKVRVRYRHQEVAAEITPVDASNATVRFEAPQKAVTPGQGAVFYRNDRVLGGGWITETFA